MASNHAAGHVGPDHPLGRQAKGAPEPKHAKREARWQTDLVEALDILDAWEGVAESEITASARLVMNHAQTRTSITMYTAPAIGETPSGGDRNGRKGRTTRYVAQSVNMLNIGLL